MKANINAMDFFRVWSKMAESKKVELLNKWSNPTLFTSAVFYDENALLKLVSNELGLENYDDYYSIDEVFYSKDDLVPGVPESQTWLRSIKIAFEHENFFKSGLFQEVSHLLITKCDLRVLVTYPDGIDPQPELDYLHKIILDTRDSNLLAEGESFLLIFGDKDENNIIWEGRIFKLKNWQKI